MKTTKEIQRLVEEHSKVIKGLIKDLQDQIKSLPDNPHIARKTTDCFIMSSSHLSCNNWSAEFYNYKKQYQIIVEALGKCEPDQAIYKLKQIIMDERLVLTSGPHNKIVFHPDVINHLLKVTGWKWTSIAHWPEGTLKFSHDVSEDGHFSKKEAQGVCNMLMNQGMGGERKIFPVKTSVDLK